jgi:hypothetical protein
LEIKANLQDLMEDRPSRDRILEEFGSQLQYEFPFLYDLSYYLYRLEDVRFYGPVEEIIQTLKEDASDLLQQILTAEASDSAFKISTV